MKQVKPNIVLISEHHQRIGLGHLIRSRFLDKHIRTYSQEAEIDTHHFSISTPTQKIQITKNDKKIIYVKNEKEILSKIEKINFNVVIIDTFYFYSNLHKYLITKKINVFYLGKPTHFACGNVHTVNVAEGNVPVPKFKSKNIFEGIGFYIPDPDLTLKKTNFTRGPLKKLLVVFGGTDAAYMSKAVYEFFRTDPKKPNIRILISSDRLHKKIMDNNNVDKLITVSGYIPNIAIHMQNYDMVLTSPGNLYFEASLLKIPVVSVCQNKRQEKDFVYYPMVFKRSELTKVLNEINTIYQKRQVNFFGQDVYPGYRLIELLKCIVSSAKETSFN